MPVSEQQAEQTSGEPGSVGSGSTVPTSPDPLIDTVMASMREASAETAVINSDHEAPPKETPANEDPPKAESPAIESPAIESPNMEATNMEATTVEATKAEMPKIEVKAEAPRAASKVLIMSAGRRSWHEEPQASTAQAEPAQAAPAQATPAQATPRQRRLVGMVALVALASAAGAIGGALATAGLTHVADAGATTSGNGTLDTAIARIDADIVALKAGLEQTSKIAMSQFNKTSDRLDRVEKAQTEPAAKLAKLSEAFEKLRAAPAAPVVAAAAPVAPVALAAPAAAPAAPKDATGVITTPAGAAALPTPATSPAPAPSASAKPDVARLPKVEGWVLRDVAHGGALIEGRTGLYEVYAGDPVPGLGRIDAIRKQDGHWVVVTSRGLVVAR
jgi:hypothetical protein